MKSQNKQQAQLGDLIAVAFEEAQRLTKDPRRAATLAATAVRRILLIHGDVRLMRMLEST
jgi:hypothetical protein